MGMHKHAAAIGALMTVMTILGVELSGFFVFRNVDGYFGLKVTAACFGMVGAVSSMACYLTDPGFPQPDPSDLSPSDPDDDTLRIRKRTLPDGAFWDQKWCRECG